jgi:hypothetical protein
MAKQSRGDLFRYLREQVGFLRKSGRDFDVGDASEALRLAVSLRVLLYDKGSSVSLLKQLGIKHQLRFLDTSPRPEPLQPGVMTKVHHSGLASIALDGTGAVFEATLGERPEDIRGPRQFTLWWHERVLEDFFGDRFTREELVLYLAHKVGGAHVDPKVEPRFHKLDRMNSLGWGWHREGDEVALVMPAGAEDTPLGSPVPVNVRQIAYEVETTLSEQVPEVREEAVSQP